MDNLIQVQNLCKDFSVEMAKFNVLYQQIYSWVRKYEATGVTALEDRRRKAKAASELSEGDLLNEKIKLLAAQNKRLEMGTGGSLLLFAQ